MATRKPEGHRRRVGAVRPSHLMFTGGVGALVDLPNFSVLVRGLDDWDYRPIPDWEPLVEPRLLAAVQTLLGKQVERLHPAPWMPDNDQSGMAARVGVPTIPFPAWMRCTACNMLAPIESQVVFGFENPKQHAPHEARFFHKNCPRKKSGPRPLAVAARFVLACTAGHMDDFPYVRFVHRGGTCEVDFPPLSMDDRGGNMGANVEIRCDRCGMRRNITEAMGRRGERSLPACRGRHPHLSTFESCPRPVRVLVVGASNQWFAQTLSSLWVPEMGAGVLDAKVAQHWNSLYGIPGPNMLPYLRGAVPALREFDKWDDQAVWDAVERHRAKLDGVEAAAAEGYPDLRTAEWEVLSAPELPEPDEDFALRRDPEGVPEPLRGVFADVVQAERLREVRALIGFTRLDAPDPEDPELVTRAPLARDRAAWVPASEVRGEGIFLRLPEDLLATWEKRVENTLALREHKEAYGRFRTHRYSDRVRGQFDKMQHWPGARFYALHTLSHLLIRTISLECGYSSASLSERVYAGGDDDPRSGILIYTAVPDAEGTLGGLVSLAEPANLVRLTRRALRDAMHCSSDPLCSERLPQAPADFLHGAACHVCLFVSETTCERGNRFLDRRFVVPIDDPDLALYPELP
ncbi:DrmB family protein [Sphaerimonospora cavernae]|uniref:DrmB family protein n=1 Tax=Sphaerimonospora cavernae TaxID=1740611 RepID=A0ABV6UCA7_9ACTN